MPLEKEQSKNPSMTRVNLNRDLNGVRELALWIIWRKRQKVSKGEDPDPVESEARSGNAERAVVARVKRARGERWWLVRGHRADQVRP